MLRAMSGERIQVGAEDRVFVLTGAGVSAESGLKTFRDQGGLWEGHRVEDVATPEAWEENAGRVWRFYSERRKGAGQRNRMRRIGRWRSWRRSWGSGFFW
jgi:NAD-dependent SIR2 family protein deacetylase